MEAKSHDLLLADGRPREISGVIQSELEELRMRGANDLTPSSRFKSRRRPMSQLKQADRKKKKG